MRPTLSRCSAHVRPPHDSLAAPTCRLPAAALPALPAAISCRRRPDRWRSSRSASRLPKCWRIRRRRRSCAPGSSTSPPPATSRRASSACRTTQSIAAMRTSAGRTSSGTCSPRTSSPSSRAAGVFRSRAASCIAATSTKTLRSATRARLRLRGDDAAVGGVAAYSTLGHFKDPVLNTMLGWSDAQLAATLFHELAHQVVYVPGDSEFNEAFATRGRGGGPRALAGGAAAAAGAGGVARAARAQTQFIALLLERARAVARALRIDAARRGEAQPQAIRVRRAEARLRAAEAHWNGYAGYDRWFDRTLNNAHLVSAATYYGCVPGCSAC